MVIKFILTQNMCVIDDPLAQTHSSSFENFVLRNFEMWGTDGQTGTSCEHSDNYRS